MDAFGSDLQTARDQAVHVAQNTLSKKIRDVRMNVDQVKEAAQGVAAAPTARARLQELGRLLGVALTGEPARIVARLLICSYYVNVVYAELETWQHLHAPEAQARMKRWQDDTPVQEMPFPYLHVFGLLPVVVMAGVSLVVPWLFAGLLLGFTVCSDAAMTWGHIKNMILHAGRPTELVMKQFALIGSAALVLAYSIRETPRLQRATAGLLRVDDPQQPRHGIKRSTLLLLGRLFVAALLVFAGYSQLLRIKARMDVARLAAAEGRIEPPMQHHWGRPDAHDNSWVLLECLLGIPLALGLFTGGVTRLLCVVLLLEAVTHWGWWGGGWPSWHYRQHVREHFFTNTAVAGGLLLMQSFGAGVLTLDSMLAKQE